MMNRTPAIIVVLNVLLAVALAGCGGSRRVAPRHAAEANPAEAAIVAEIEEMGGEVTLDPTSPEKWVRQVRLTCTKVSDPWLERLKGLTKLQALILNCTNISDAGLKHLKGVTTLRNLSLFDTLVTDAGLAHLSELPNLQSLTLRGPNALQRQLGSNANIPRVYSSTGLRRPDTPGGSKGTHITDAGLEHLQKLTSLQSLCLESTLVTSAGLKHLQGLTNLGDLDLGDTAVGDAGLVHLKGLTKLQDLNLYNTDVTDAGLEHLKGLLNLQWLTLGGSLGPVGNARVTDAGLEKLTGLTSLVYLGLWGTQVSRHGVAKLQSALPACTVHSPYGDHRARISVHRERIPGTHYWKQTRQTESKEGPVQKETPPKP